MIKSKSSNREHFVANKLTEIQSDLAISNSDYKIVSRNKRDSLAVNDNILYKYSGFESSDNQENLDFKQTTLTQIEIREIKSELVNLKNKNKKFFILN